MEEKKTLLFVNCCISQRGEASRTRRLADAFLTPYLARHPEMTLREADLTAMELAPFNVERLNARDALAMAGKFDDPVFALARDFQSADCIVVAAPFWDLSYPAQLRIYMEHISANGLTYHYDDKGCHGDCRAARLIYLTSGGDFQRENSIGLLHWEQLAKMCGIPEFRYVFADGLDAVPETTDQRLADALAQAAALAESL